MFGLAADATDVSVAERAQLDAIAESVARMEAGQREGVGQLVQLWPVSGWLAAGARSAKAWLHAHAGQSWNEAARLERIAQVCSRDGLRCGRAHRRGDRHHDRARAPD